MSEAVHHDKENNVIIYNCLWFYDEQPIFKLMREKHISYEEAFNEHFKEYGMTIGVRKTQGGGD